MPATDPHLAPLALPTTASRWHPVLVLRRHPFIADALLALGLLVLGVTGLFVADYGPGHETSAPNALAVVLVCYMTLPLAFRRRAPIAVLAVTLGGMIPFLILNFPDSLGTLGPLVAMYTVGARCERRRSFAAFAVAALVMLPVMIAGTVVEQVHLPWAAVFGNYAIYFTAWVLGDSLRTRRAYLYQLEQRAEEADQRREEAAERAVAAERDRIARELHDVVAHSMAVMVVQAGAARRVLPTRPEQADQAMRQVEATGREAMVEMRRLVGVLRGDGTDGEGADVLAPQPGLDALPTLVEQWEQAGLPIELEVDGDRRPVQAGVDLSAYRIVQEALTNTFKHAGAARARVHVTYRDRDLELVVTDDGRGLAARRTRTEHDIDGADDTGHGLVGMRERVAMVGGDLRVGPRPGGGFEVAARLPLAT